MEKFNIVKKKNINILIFIIRFVDNIEIMRNDNKNNGKLMEFFFNTMRHF